MAQVEGYAALARARMAATLRRRGISERTVAAFGRVPRHVLVPRFWADPVARSPAATDVVELRADGGAVVALDVLHDVDRAVAVNRVAGAPGQATSTASAPGLLAAQADQLALEDGMSVLEIGTGPGYFAAIIAELVGPGGRVVTVDIDADIASAAAERVRACGYEQVTVVVGDGAVVASALGPFDRVVASVGCADVASAWLAELAPEGRALIPLLHGATHPMVEVDGDGRGRVVMRSGYVAIQGRQAGAGLWPHARAAVEPAESEPLPDDLRALLAVEPGRETLFGLQEWNLAFWVAISDQRAGFLATLNDGAGSTARVDAAKGRLRWGGPDGRRLAADLMGHLEGWVAAGTPAIESFAHRFVPRDTGAGRCVIRRVDHDQVITA